MTATAERAKRGAREVQDSKPVEGLARLGLLGRGLIYVVMGLLALEVALGGSARADKHGALEALRDQPLGGALLVVLAVSFAGYALWRLLEAAVGRRDEDGFKRTRKRLLSLARATLYVVLATTIVRFLVDDRSERDKTEPRTAQVLALTGGRSAVGLIGAVVVGGGLYMAYRGAAEKFLRHLDLSGAPHAVRAVVPVLGKVALVGRGLIVVLIGSFLLQAAVTFNADKANGLDASLKSLAGAPFGMALLLVAVVALLTYGLWSFIEARYRKV